MPEPIRIGAAGIDLSGRLFRSAAVAASPAAAAITTVASVSIPDDLAVTEGVLVFGYAAFTVGTLGDAVTTQIRRTNTTGTVIKSSGALTVVAAQLHDSAIVGFDTGPTLPGQVYVVCLTVANATAETTVSAVELVALVI